MREAPWDKNLLELIRRTATDLPADVETALKKALKDERRRSRARWGLEAMLANAAEARRAGLPICQDSGTLTFYLSVPGGSDTNALTARIRTAVARATRLGYLRQNTFDSVTGAPYATNIAHASPVVCFEQAARKTVEVRLLMKGGGCENVGRQYSLPDAEFGADRDLEGVRRCVMDALWRAQGLGCAPGVVGVCVGGDRAAGYEHAKVQFLHKVGHRSRVRALARLEDRILRDSRRLGIGPLGMGGRTTLLGVHIGSLSRVPASFFVSVAYMCWAFRRRGAVLGPEGGLRRWLY
jgi:fumarate hydratase class I